jgi:hypothetical protein
MAIVIHAFLIGRSTEGRYQATAASHLNSIKNIIIKTKKLKYYFRRKRRHCQKNRNVGNKEKSEKLPF